MSSADSLRSLRCPNCGAPLDLTPGQTTIRCRFCDSVFEHSSDAVTADDHSRIISADATSGAGAGYTASQAKRYIIKMRNGMPVVIEAGGAGGMGQPASPMDAAAQAWQSGSSPSYVASVPVITTPTVQAGGGSRLGCILSLVFAAIVVCAVVPAIVVSVSPAAALMVGQLLSGNWQQALGTAGTLGTRIMVGSSGTIVPGLNDAPAQAIMLTRQYPASGGNYEMRLVALDTSTRKLVWQTAPLDKQLNDTPILVNQDSVVIVNNQTLMAFHRADGTTAWQAALADKLQLSICHDCVQLAGNRVVALTDDGTLEAFDAASGQSQWKVTAQQSSPRGLYVLGKRVAFMDRDKDVHGVLRTFDLETGKETSVQPACKGSEPEPDYAEWTTPLYVSPKGTDVYLIFGSFAQCAQRWDAQTLKMVWSTPLPSGFSGNIDGLPAIFSADTMYVAVGPGVLAFPLDGSAASILASDADYNLQQALATHGADVIVLAKRERGTARYEIWAVNGTSGQPHWKFDLGTNQPLDPGGIIANKEQVWMVQPGADGLRVMQFQSTNSENKTYTLLQDVLSWDSGTSAGQTKTPLSLDTIILTAPDWMVTKNNLIWMAMNDELLALDTTQNKITFQWP